MRRRDVIALLGAAAAAWPLSTGAQAPARIFRLGFLGPTSGPVPEHQAFFDALSQLGYREGQNLIVERRFAAGEDGRLPTLAADLVRTGVDIIVTQSTTATAAAKGATTTIPIVMGSTADAIGSNLVTSLSHPGGNVTGTSFLGAVWAIKHVQLILELRPGAGRLAFLADFLFQPEPLMYRHMQEAAANQGAEMLLYDVRRAQDYEPAFASMVAARIDGLAVAPNVVHRERRDQLVALAAATNCRPFTEVATWWRPGASCPTGSTFQTCGAKRPTTSIRYSGAPSSATCRLSSRPNSSW